MMQSIIGVEYKFYDIKKKYTYFLYMMVRKSLNPDRCLNKMF